MIELTLRILFWAFVAGVAIALLVLPTYLLDKWMDPK